MTANELSEKQLAHLWKVKPSQTEGYHRSYHTETQNGDLLAVDFNYPRRMVRISLQMASEGMREYVSVIKSGTILQEREVVGRRTVDLTHKISPLIPYFSLLPDTALLETIKGCYGIPQTNPLATRNGKLPTLPIYHKKYGFSLRKLLREYLEKKRQKEQQTTGFFRKLLHRLPAECLDIGIGFLMLGLFGAGFMNLTELAGYTGSLALFCGAWDWVWRQRDPFIPKILALLSLSGWAVYWQIQNRMWAIFL